jgi:hypothetical protein
LLNEASSGGESLEDGTDIGSLLHGDDSKLIFFVNPDEESLVVVMEDTSSLWPISLETAGFEIFISTLEEEVISDELSLIFSSHFWEGVVFTLKFSGEFVKSRDDEIFGLNSVNSGDLGTEWESGEVSSNSDSSGVDHLVLILWEWWALKLVDIHGRNVLISLGVTVVVIDNFIEKWGESIVGIVGSSVDTNTRVGPFGSGEDSLLESESVFIFLVLAFFPNIWGKAF